MVPVPLVLDMVFDDVFLRPSFCESIFWSLISIFGLADSAESSFTFPIPSLDSTLTRTPSSRWGIN